MSEPTDKQDAAREWAAAGRILRDALDAVSIW